jgi:hypothetical protein
MVESADAIAEASAAGLDGAASAKAVRACLVMSSTDAVGMTMGAVPARLARLAAERVLDAADRKTPFPGELTVGFARAAAAADHKPPFPGELTVGFPGESKAPTAALMVPATEVAIGVSMDAVPVWVVAERVLDAADRKPPFPGELMVGFPVKSKAPTAALTGVLLAVALGMEKRGGDKEARFPDGLGAIGVEGAVSVCLFLSALFARELGGGALP